MWSLDQHAAVITLTFFRNCYLESLNPSAIIIPFKSLRYVIPLGDDRQRIVQKVSPALWART